MKLEPLPLPAWLTKPRVPMLESGTKTREIAPWNLRAGMRLVLSGPYGGPKLYTIAHIEKFRSSFTGATCWRVFYNDLDSNTLPRPAVHFHGKLNRLPAEKATIAIR